MDPFERVKRAVRDAMAQSARSAASQPNEKTPESAYENGDFAEAEQLFAAAVQQLEGRSSDRKRYGKTLLMLSLSQWKQEKLPEAKANAGLARPILFETRQYADLAECLTILGSVAMEQQDSDAAVALLGEAVETVERVKPQNPLTNANLLRQWSEALRRAGAFDKAKTAASRALNVVQDRYGKDDVNTGECLLQLGQCERDAGEAAAAIQTLRRALDIFQLDRGRDSGQEIKTLQCLAEACQAAGDLEQAVGFYERALKERDRQLGGKAEDVASLLTNLGGLLSLLGRHGPAIELLQQAVVRLEGAKDQRLGSALDLLGNTYFQFGRFEDAVSCVQRARNVWESNPTGNRQALEANETLLMDIAAYLPYQRRLALGLATDADQAESAAAAKRKKTTAPWDAPETDAKKEPEKHASPPRRPPPARPHRKVPSASADSMAELTAPPPAGMISGAGYSPHPDTRGIPNSPMPPGAMYAQNGYLPVAEQGPPMAFIDAAGRPVYPVYSSDSAPGPAYSVQGFPGNMVGNAPGVSVTLLRADGTVVEPGAVGNGPMHLNLVLADPAEPGFAVGVSEHSIVAEEVSATGLNGWDDLGFEFVPRADGRAA